jgi:hypothetical protein
VDLSHNETRVHLYPLGKAKNISLGDVWVSLNDELFEFTLRN